MKEDNMVLDSFALIAYLEDEKGAEEVQRALERAEEKGQRQILMSLINWGEVYYSVSRAKGIKRADECVSAIDQLPIRLIAPDREQVLEASRIKAEHSIAYGDCFAAALAIGRDCVVLTGDREFEKMDRKVKVSWL